MGQLDLFDPVRLARHTDPHTSHAAARAAGALRADHHRAIVAVLAKSDQPLTAEAIADRTAALDSIQVSRRIHELVDAGVVTIDGDARTTSGRMARCYRIT